MQWLCLNFEAIPNKLDVIIGNRYFQLKFEVEPFSPNIGLRNLWKTQNNENEDHGNGAKKDTEMEEAQSNEGAKGPDGTGGGRFQSFTGNNGKDTENQLEYD